MVSQHLVDFPVFIDFVDFPDDSGLLKEIAMLTEKLLDYNYIIYRQQ